MRLSVRRFLWLSGLLGWMLVIFWFSSQTGEVSAAQSMPLAELLGVPDFVIRKGAHMTEYGILAILSAGFLGTFRLSGIREALGTLAISLSYAAGDEFHQLFSEGRSGQPRDVLIDMVGAVLGLLAFKVLRFLIRNNSRRKL